MNDLARITSNYCCVFVPLSSSDGTFSSSYAYLIHKTESGFNSRFMYYLDKGSLWYYDTESNRESFHNLYVIKLNSLYNELRVEDGPSASVSFNYIKGSMP